MPLFAEQFFTGHLALPYPEAAVVGDTYYARPVSDLPLRLRVSFADTSYHKRYDALRVEVVHPEQARIDAQLLYFAEHGAFAARDKRLDWRPGDGLHGTFTDWHPRGAPPWEGINVTPLRAAIDRYVQLWFPGAPSVHTGPKAPAAVPTRPAARAARSR
ncbi:MULTISPECIES: hypothetical protein [Streptomyces]|uniref:Uncharacterized protein n=2 Tax=Streptomyces TaxID=1883 RepID=A0A100Y6H1_9ACTN|nr:MULTISPECIES: hypothetical protein [Streptomyces]KUH38548.1 hypothetical protein ATE80_11750 [Streptomyces kanasensis]UUS33970.1 hypothetical protein NRO40_26200 [Streptomyces changanensis]